MSDAGHATDNRVREIHDEAESIAWLLAGMAEELLFAANRMRDASIQAHFEGIGRVRNTQRNLLGLEARIRENHLRWRDVA